MGWIILFSILTIICLVISGVLFGDNGDLAVGLLFLGVLLLFLTILSTDTYVSDNVKDTYYNQGVTDALDGKVKFEKQIQLDGTYQWIKMNESNNSSSKDTVIIKEIVYVKDTCE